MARLLKLAIGGALCAAVAATAWHLLQPYLLGTADLETVRKDVSERVADLLADHELAPGAPIFIRIFKASSELEMWVEDGEAYRLVKTYPICSYSGDLGPKLVILT